MTATTPINDLATLTRGLTRASDVFLAPTDRIEVSPFQAREFFDQEKLEELADDIQAKEGVLHPILLRPHPTRAGWFQLVAGERRWRATVMRFGATIRATVRDWNDIQAAEIGLQENLKDESLTDFEEAKGTRSLWQMYADQGAEYNDTQFARHIKKSVTFITNCWKILNLDPDLLEVARTRQGVKSSLFAISDVKDSTKREEYLTMVKKGDSFRTVTEQIKKDETRKALLNQSNKAPDTQTNIRQKARRRGESSSMSRGRQVTGPSSKEVRDEVNRHLLAIVGLVPHLSDDDYKQFVEPTARRLLRGDLSR